MRLVLPNRSIAVRAGAALCAIAAMACLALTLQDIFNLQRLQALVAALTTTRSEHPLLFATAFFATYIAVTALCIPLEIPCALAAGALFGLAQGVLLASFASVIGATLAFWTARFLLRDTVTRRFPGHLDTINAGLSANGAIYLVGLRLQPVLPFGAVNVLMGLTNMRTHVFCMVSQLSMLFATVVFVGAGLRLASIHTYGDIFSIPLMAGLAVLGLTPLLAGIALKAIRRRRLVAFV